MIPVATVVALLVSAAAAGFLAGGLAAHLRLRRYAFALGVMADHIDAAVNALDDLGFALPRPDVEQRART